MNSLPKFFFVCVCIEGMITNAFDLQEKYEGVRAWTIAVCQNKCVCLDLTNIAMHFFAVKEMEKKKKREEGGKEAKKILPACSDKRFKNNKM